MTENQDQYWDAENAAGQLHVKLATVNLWIRQKKIKAVLSGRKYLIRNEELLRFIDEQTGKLRQNGKKRRAQKSE